MPNRENRMRVPSSSSLALVVLADSSEKAAPLKPQRSRPLGNLPIELVHHTLKYLRSREIVSFSRVSLASYEATRSNAVWIPSLRFEGGRVAGKRDSSERRVGLLGIEPS